MWGFSVIWNKNEGPRVLSQLGNKGEKLLFLPVLVHGTNGYNHKFLESWDDLRTI